MELSNHDLFLPTGGKGSVFLCSYCGLDISSQLRIHCVTCSNFRLCSDCFSVGVELYPHKNCHSYRVVDCLDYPIFSKDWSVAEELLLLEGIDKFGVGNWKTVSDHVGSKTARACDDHYWELYMGSYGHCLPAQYFDNDSLRELDIAVPSEIHLPEPVSSSSRLIVRGSNGDGSTGKGSSKKEIDFKEKMSQLPGADLAGYMPLREDFDIEYNNDAELLLADMEFSSEGTSKPIEEHPSEVQLKLDVIRIYNEKLDERDKRKRFVIDRGVVDIRKQTNSDRRRLKEDKELVARLRVLSRFQTAQEFDTLVDGLLMCRRLRKNMEYLRHYRSMGIRTLEQARAYETERRKREHQIKALRQRQSMSQQVDLASIQALASPAYNSSSGPYSSLSEIGNNTSSAFESLASAPAGNLLTQGELKLCSAISMLPLQYVAVKEAVIREAFRNGTLTHSGMRRIFNTNSILNEMTEVEDNISPTLTTIYDFFVANGINACARNNGDAGN